MCAQHFQSVAVGPRIRTCLWRRTCGKRGDGTKLPREAESPVWICCSQGQEKASLFLPRPLSSLFLSSPQHKKGWAKGILESLSNGAKANRDETLCCIRSSHVPGDMGRGCKERWEKRQEMGGKERSSVHKPVCSADRLFHSLLRMASHCQLSFI